MMGYATIAFLYSLALTTNIRSISCAAIEKAQLTTTTTPAPPRIYYVFCFPGDSLVHTKNGNKLMQDVRIGDEVLTLEAGKFIYSPVYTFGHRDEAEPTPYLEIHLDNGSHNTISAKHLIQVNEEGTFKFADQVVPGDNIFRINQQHEILELEEARVEHITNITKEGFYAPFTLSGTIVVDDVLASCYANVADVGPVSAQVLAHAGVAPLRAAHYAGLTHLLEISAGKDMPAAVEASIGLFGSLLTY